MSILLTVVFENGFCELYMPLVDNKTCPVAIRPSTSGWDEDIILPLEVWDGVWYLKESRQYAITINEKAVGETVLAPGTLLNCEMKNSEMVFSVTVDEVGAGNTRFNKYFLNPELMPRITIGSGEESIIRYSNSFVSPSHAEIISMGGKVEIRDLDSVNGTFVNGRLLTEKRELRYGDVIYIIGLKIVYLGNILAINNPKDQCAVSRLKPITVTAGTHIEDEEDGGEFDDSENYFLRTPRKLEKLDTESFTIEKCPKKEEQKRQPLLFTIGPSFTMVIPMAVGAMMSSGGGFGASGLVMSVGAAGIGAAWALVNANYQKKLEIEREAKRVGSYQEYISRMNQRIQEKVNRNRDIIEKITWDLIWHSMASGNLWNARNQFNLRISLMDYWNQNRRYESSMKQIREQLRSHLQSTEEWELESEQAFAYALGQAAMFLLSRSKASKLPSSMVNAVINVKNHEMARKKLKYLFLKYNYDIDFEKSKRLKSLMAHIMMYEPKGKLDQEMVLAGMADELLLYEKSEKSEEKENKE